MMEVAFLLTEREWATLVVAATLMTICILIPRLRRFLTPLVRNVIRAALARRIIGVYCGLLVWAALVVFCGWLAGLWSVGLLKDTIVIVVTLGFPILYRSIAAKSGPEIFRRVFRESAGITALLLFYISLWSFPFFTELAFQFSLFFVVASIGAASFMLKNLPDIEESSGKSCLLVLARLVQLSFSPLLFVAALGAFAWTTSQLVLNAQTVIWLDLLKSFLLTLWLPALLIPYFYIAAFSAYCEVVLQRLSLRKKVPLSVQLAFIFGLHLRVTLAARFDGRYKSLGRDLTFLAALKTMKAFRADLRRRDDEETARHSSIAARTGVRGTDNENAQLDRREFDETKRQLDWISTTQLTRYAGNGNRYWDDLTDTMVDIGRFGLPKEHGFVTDISLDGQRWRCWRRLPSGWYLGIGGAAGQDEFYFQGDAPPINWPGEDPPAGWGSHLQDNVPPDWIKDDRSRL